MVQKGEDTVPAAPRRPAIYKDLVLIQLALLVFLTDQLTKYLVREFLELHESFPEQGFFRFTHTFNTGSAFGLFQGQNMPLILVSMVGITILVLIYRSQRRQTNLLRLSLGLQLGGAAGNLLDRFRLGHVTDFVDVGSWPIFNVADSSIMVGLALLAWIFLVADGQGRKSAETLPVSEPGSAATEPESQAAALDSAGDEPGMPDLSRDAPMGIASPSHQSPSDQRVGSESSREDGPISGSADVGAPPGSEDDGSSSRTSLPPVGE